MGYDVHITRARFWAENAAHPIAAEEWLAYIEKDPELEHFPDNCPYFARWSSKAGTPDSWLDWSSGNIYTKYPDEELIDKMVAIAGELQAKVQGDDGETYTSGHEPPAYPKQSIPDRLHGWLNALRPAPRIERIDPRFKVGDRVLGLFGKEATVLAIDSESNHGLGKVTIRYGDGREMAFMLDASGLSPLSRKIGSDDLGTK